MSTYTTPKSYRSAKQPVCTDGKLARLLKMPIDLFFEIASQLEPLDILQLSRVSKEFRTTFASKTSLHIWVAARKNVYNMPDCAPFVSELQFASFMFERHCQACGELRVQMVDYSFKVKFCAPCFKENIKKGSDALIPYDNIPDIVLTLLPRSLLSKITANLALLVWRAEATVHHIGCHYDYPVKPPKYDKESFEAKNNCRQNAFYIPQVEMVVKRYQELESDPIALKRFVAEQQAIASVIMNNARYLSDWKFYGQIRQDLKHMDIHEAAPKQIFWKSR